MPSCSAAYFLLAEGFQIIILSQTWIQRCLELWKLLLSIKTTHGWHSSVSGPHAWITLRKMWSVGARKHEMKNYSDQCQQIHDIQARKVVPFPAGLRMFVPGQGFGLPLYHVPSTKSTCNEAVTNEPANINETDTANILASNDTCKTPQMYLLHSKGHLLGEFWSKAWSISPRLSTKHRGPITRRIWILHPMSDIRRDKKSSSCNYKRQKHRGGSAALFSILQCCGILVWKHPSRWAESFLTRKEVWKLL